MKNEIYIYSDVGGLWGISSAGFADALRRYNGEDVTLRINSPGGVVADGVAIYNLIKSYSGKVTAVIDGYAASIASIIAMGASEIIMGQGSLMFLHNAISFLGAGNAEQLRKEANALDQHDVGLVDIYAKRTGKTPEEIKAMMAAETFLTAEQAVANGFADKIGVSVDGSPIQNSLHMSFFSTIKNAAPMAEAFKAANLDFTPEAFAAFAAKAAKADEVDQLISDAIAKASADIDAANAALATAKAEHAAALKAMQDSVEAEKAKIEATAAAKAAEIVAATGFKAPVAQAPQESQKTNLTGLARAVNAHRTESQKK